MFNVGNGCGCSFVAVAVAVAVIVFVVVVAVVIGVLSALDPAIALQRHHFVHEFLELRGDGQVDGLDLLSQPRERGRVISNNTTQHTTVKQVS